MRNFSTGCHTVHSSLHTRPDGQRRGSADKGRQHHRRHKCSDNAVCRYSLTDNGAVAIELAMPSPSNCRFSRPRPLGVALSAGRNQYLVEFDGPDGAVFCFCGCGVRASRVAEPGDLHAGQHRDAVGWQMLLRRPRIPVRLQLASRRGSISTCVTSEPSRQNACDSSQPMAPPPSTSSRRGSSCSSQRLSEVR